MSTSESVVKVMLVDDHILVLEGIRARLEQEKGIDVVGQAILSMHDNREYISQLMFHGAKGYILKDVSVEEMVSAIRTVADGATYICRAATETLFRHGETMEPVESKLTRREEAILSRVAKGLSSKAISNELNISVRTVETHRQNIKSKLDLNTTAELTKYAYDQQLL